MPSNKKTSSSVDRTLGLLEVISFSRHGLSLAEIAQVTDIPKTTIFRLLEKLTYHEYVYYEKDTERYVAGLKVIDIGISALINMNIVDASIPYLRDLSETTGETAFLGVYSEGEIVYLYKSEGTQAIMTNSKLGSRRPVHCTGLGKAILSGFSNNNIIDILEEKGMRKFTKYTLITSDKYIEEMEKVRNDGMAVELEELEMGLGCVAMPVYDYTAKIVGAICVSGPVKRISENKNNLVTILSESVQHISRRLGFVPSMLN